MPEPTTQAAPQQQPTPTSGPPSGSTAVQRGGRDRMRSSLRSASFDEGAELLSPGAVDANGPAYGGHLGMYAPVQRRARADQAPTGQLGDVVQLRPDGGPDTAPAPGGPGPDAPEDEAPELSPAALELLDDVDDALHLGRPDKGARKKRKERRGDALALIRAIAASPVHAEVVGALDGDQRMSRLLEFAGYKQIWGDVATTEATLVLLKDRDPAKCKEDVRALTTSQAHLFERTEVKGEDGKTTKKGPIRLEIDLATNRWEARMAWELLLVLPEAEREALMHPGDASKERWDDVHAMKKGKDKRHARKDAKKADQLEDAATGTRIDRNLSWEYKESSRYDQYQGNEAKTVALDETKVIDPPLATDDTPTSTDQALDLTPGVGATKDDGAPVAPQPDPILAAPTLETTTTTAATREDTDREALIAQALDEALWTKAPEARLRSVLRMVVQAGEGPTIANQVKAHWASHEALLIALGFDGDGSWKEIIVDATASNWLQRGLAATGAICQTIGLVGGLLGGGKVKFKKSVDLQALAAGFPALTGVRLKPHERPTDPLAIVGYIFGGAGPAAWVLKVTGLGPKELLDTLQSVKDAGKWFMRQLKHADLVAEGVEALEELLDNKPASKQDDSNYLVLEGNELTGETTVGLPLLDIAATARRSGDSLIKTEASQAVGISIGIKRRTALSQDRHIRVAIEGIDIAGLQLVGTDSITSVDTISLRGLDIAFESPEAKPATWIAKVGHLVQAIGGQILKALPFTWWMAAIRDVALIGPRLTDLILQLTQGLFVDGSKLTVALGGVDVLGLAESGGDHIDRLSIGQTDMRVEDERGLGFQRDNLASRKEKKAARLHAKAERLAGQLEARKDAREESGKSTEEMWFLEQALVEGKDKQLEKRAGRLEKRADKTDADVHTADTAAEREKDLVPGRIRRQRDEARRALARLEVRLGRPGLEPERAAELKAEQERVQGVAARLDRTIADHVKVSELQWQVEDQEKVLAAAREAGDSAKVQAAQGQIAVLQGRIAHLRTEALELEATIGPITVEGVDMGGVEVGSITSEAFEVSQEKSTGPEDKRGATITNARITVSDVAIKSDRRRDVVIAQEINQLEEAARGAAREPTKEERERIRILQQELAYLQPFIKEYELLRERVAELGADEQARMMQLREQLESPASFTARKVEVKNLQAGGGFTLEEGGDKGADGKQAAGGTVGHEVGASVGEVSVEDVASRDTAKFAYGGDLTVKHVTASDFGMAMDVENALGDGSEQDALSGGLKKGVVEDLTYAGKTTEAAAQREQALADIAATRAEIAKLSSKAPRTEPDGARLAALEEQLAAQQGALASHEEVLAEPKRFAALIPQLEAKLGALNVKGVDNARGTSLSALVKASAKLDDAKTKLSVAECDKRIASYAKGIAQLEAELGPMKAELEQEKAGQAKVLALPKHEQAAYHPELLAAPIEVKSRAIAERQGILDRAKAAKAAWTKKRKDIDKAKDALRSQKQAVDDLAGRYAEIVQLAGDAGLERVAAANGTPLRDLSAYSMVKLAEGGVLEGEDWHVDAIVIDDVGAGTTLGAGESDVDAHGSVTVTGVKHGDQTVVDELKLAGLGGGLSYDAKAKLIRFDGFGLNLVSLSSLHWEGGGMAAHANTPVTIDGLAVTGSYDLKSGATKIEEIDVAAVTSGDLLYRYADMELGAAAGGSLGLKHVVIKELNLTTFDFVMDADFATEKLALDLTQGMTVGAQALSGRMHVDALVTDNEYQVALSDLSADDIEVKMPGMGVVVRQIRGGKANIGADVGKSVYDFGVDVKTLGLGPIDYDADGMGFHAVSGLDLQTVHVKGSAKLDETGTHTLVESLTAAHATVPQLKLVMGEGKEAMSFSVRGGSLDNLALTGLDLDTMAMDVTFDNGQLNGMALAMEGMVLSGGVGVKKMHYAALRGPDGKDLGMVLGFAGVDAKVKTDLGTTEEVTGEGGEKSTEKLEREIDTVVDDASGELKMQGDRTSFRGVAVKSVKLPSMVWESSGSAIRGHGVSVGGIKADGYYETYEKDVRGMKLPTSDLVITRLHVDTVLGDEITYEAGDTVVTVGKVGSGRDERKKATKLTNLDVVNLRQIDGVMESGHIALEHLETGAEAAIGGALRAGGALSAEGIFCDFEHGKTSFGLTTLEITEVHGEKEFPHEVYNLPGRSVPVGQKSEKQDRLVFDVPRALLSVVEGDAAFEFLEDEKSASVNDEINATVQAFIVMEDGTAKYYMDEAAPKPPILEEEKSTNAYEADAQSARGVMQLLEQLQPIFQDLDVDLFAALSSNGLLTVPNLHLKVDKGVLDDKALLASLASARVKGANLHLDKLIKVETQVVDGEVVVAVKLDQDILQGVLAVAGLTVGGLVSAIPVIGPALGVVVVVGATAGIIYLEFTGDYQALQMTDSAGNAPGDWKAQDGGTPLYTLAHAATRDYYANPAEEKLKEVNEHPGDVNGKAQDARVKRDGRQHFELPGEIEALRARIAEMDKERTWGGDPMDQKAAQTMKLIAERRLQELEHEQAVLNGTAKSGPMAEISDLHGLIRLAVPDEMPQGRDVDVAGLKLHYHDIVANLGPVAPNVFNARLRANDLGITTKVGAGELDAKIGWAELGLDVNALRQGFLPVGGTDPGLKNPVVGTLKGGSKLENVAISYKVKARNNK